MVSCGSLFAICEKQFMPASLLHFSNLRCVSCDHRSQNMVCEHGLSGMVDNMDETRPGNPGTLVLVLV